MMEAQVTAVYPDNSKWKFIIVHGDDGRGYEFKQKEEAEKARKSMVKALMAKGFKIFM